MKTHFLKTVLILATTFMVSCSKDDDDPVIEPIPESVAFDCVNSTALNIPDLANGINGVAESTINIEKTGIVKNPNKVTLEIDMEASWIGELVIQLIAPNGDTTTVIKRIGNAIANGGVEDSSNFKTGEKLSFNAGFTIVMPFASLGQTDFIPTGNYDTIFGLTCKVVKYLLKSNEFFN